MKSFSELTSASQVNNDDLLAISQTSGNGYASKKTTVKDITDKSNLNLADEYDSTSTYAVDDYVIYESVLYKCIGTTTGTFDSTKWTNVVVTDEMGSGGGGGTGGHTIIDENGNSMPARAGLQFVGGANVEDDATNNKTIVDLASAGGIDGVFVDTGNLIDTESSDSSGNMSYTATEDCFAIIRAFLKDTSTAILIKVDGVLLFGNRVNSVSVTSSFIMNSTLLKKGQVLTVEGCYVTNDNFIRVYGIQTGTTHSKFQPVIYSTEEREIGVWVNGKPLYERTYIGGTIPASSNLDIPINTTNVDEIFISKAVTYSSTQGFSLILNDVIPTYAQHSKRIYLSKSASKIVIDNGDTDNFYDKTYITVIYTKTTDVAGSGSWTPQGVPTHHYSTDEQVIGTYLGETLYEKTIVVSALSIGENTINHLISGISEIIKVEGKANYSGDCINMPYTSTVNGYVIGIQANATRILINVGASFNANDFSNISITLKYTKTS